MTWLDKIRSFFHKQPEPNVRGESAVGEIPTQMFISLAESLVSTQSQEVACDEVESLMDEFAEIMARGEDTSRILPFVKLHCDHCPDCREEFEALLAMMAAYQADTRPTAPT